MKKIMLLAVFFITTASASNAQLASPGTIYASTSDGKIYELNEDYSQRVLVVQTDLEELRSIAINSWGELYAVDRDSLYAINLSTGEATAITAAPTPQSQFSTISFNQADQLYVVESTINSSFWHNLQSYSFELDQFEINKRLSDNDDAFISSLAIDPYTNTHYYLYRPPFFDNILLGEVQDSPLTPKMTQLDDVSGGLLHFDSQGRLAVVQYNMINYVDRFSGKVYARETKAEFAYSDIASVLSTPETLPPVIVEAGQLLDFDEIATGRFGEQQISVANMSNDEVVISFSKTDESDAATLELPESITLAPKIRNSFTFRLHVEKEGLLTGGLELKHGAAESDIINVQYQAVGFEVHPINTEALYAISRTSATGPHNLNLVDLENKKAMRICTLSKSIGMLSANSEGVLYGVTNGYLYLVDAESGKAQKLASIGFTPRSIAFDLADSLYVPYIDLEDGSIPYVYLNKYNISTGKINLRTYTIVSGVGYSPGTGQIAVSPTGWVAMLGEKGLAYGEESLYATESVFPEDQLKLDLNLKDIGFYKDGSILGYGTTLGRIDLESSEFKPVGVNLLGFVGFVKHVSPLDLLRANGTAMVAYPNPLKEAVTILFELNEASAVQLDVFSVNGQKAASINQDFAQPGPSEITWNGRDASGNRMKEGMYILRLFVNNKLHAVQRVLLEP